MCLLASDKIAVKHVSWNLFVFVVFLHICWCSHTCSSCFHAHIHSPTLWNVGRFLSAVGGIIIIIIISRLRAHCEFATGLCACLSTSLWAGPKPGPLYQLWPWAAGLGDGVHLGGVSRHTVSGTTGQGTARVVWATDQTAERKKETENKKKRHNITQKWPQNEWI